jgi:hypothetical protein
VNPTIHIKIEIHNKMADSTMDTLAIWAYWILGLLVVGTMCYIMYTRFNKQVAAVLTFLTSMMALYYYYVKWFIIGDSYKELPTLCPDFMAKLATHGDKLVCYDPSKFNDKASAVSAFDSMKAQITSTTTGYIDTDRRFVIKADDSNMATFCGTLRNSGLSWISACKTIA